MNDELAELRQEIATSRGLPPSAGSLLTGTTLAELEQCADELAQFVARDDVGDQEPEPETFQDVISASLAGRAQQAALIRALHGCAGPPRDAAGRFVSTGFDGGARTPFPIRQDPVREHGELIAQMASLSRMYGRTYRG